jgi:hypothetical protein
MNHAVLSEDPKINHKKRTRVPRIDSKKLDIVNGLVETSNYINSLKSLTDTVEGTRHDVLKKMQKDFVSKLNKAEKHKKKITSKLEKMKNTKDADLKKLAANLEKFVKKNAFGLDLGFDCVFSSEAFTSGWRSVLKMKVENKNSSPSCIFFTLVKEIGLDGTKRFSLATSEKVNFSISDNDFELQDTTAEPKFDKEKISSFLLLKGFRSAKNKAEEFSLEFSKLLPYFKNLTLKENEGEYVIGWRGCGSLSGMRKNCLKVSASEENSMKNNFKSAIKSIKSLKGLLKGSTRFEDGDDWEHGGDSTFPIFRFVDNEISVSWDEVEAVPRGWSIYFDFTINIPKKRGTGKKHVEIIRSALNDLNRGCRVVRWEDSY